MTDFKEFLFILFFISSEQGDLKEKKGNLNVKAKLICSFLFFLLKRRQIAYSPPLAALTISYALFLLLSLLISLYISLSLYVYVCVCICVRPLRKQKRQNMLADLSNRSIAQSFAWEGKKERDWLYVPSSGQLSY